MKTTFLLFIAILGICGNVHAMGSCYGNSCINEGVEASIDFIGGYRYDKLKTSVNVYDPPENLILTDNLKINDINIYEVGVGGRILVCREWLVRLYGTFGQVQNGQYTEVVSVPGAQSNTKSHVRKGNTNDFSVGGGYLFPCGCGFGVGPVAGWSYDYERVKMGRAKTDGLPEPVLDDLTYKMRWQGPWLGVEGQYNCYNARVSLGYEYHWSHWHASWTLHGPDVPGVAFSDRRKSNDAFGNVIFLDGAYGFCDSWEIGLGFKAQYWKANGGRVLPRAKNIAEAGVSPTEVDRVRSAIWHSYEVVVTVGYQF